MLALKRGLDCDLARGRLLPARADHAAGRPQTLQRVGGLMLYRQEVLNVILAQLLQEQGQIAAPEQVLRHPEGSTQLPDVLVDFQGLRLVIEAEIGKAKDKQDRARKKAQERVDQGIAHVGVAVAYPKELSEIKDFSRLKAGMSRANLDFAIITEVTPKRVQGEFWPSPPQEAPFMTGTVADLADFLRRSYEQLVKDETLTKAVSKVEASIEEFVHALRAQPATAERMALKVGVGLHSARGGKDGFTPAQKTAIGRIGALVLVNALIFQEVLSKKERQAHPLHKFLHSADLQGEILEEWKLILKINYFPIFHIAQEVLQCLAADKDSNDALDSLVETARHIVGWRAALRHDLAGRIYHRLLEEAKYLGAYYTAIPSAALLLKLGLRPDRYSNTDWANLDDVGKFHVADLACGTGTLLMASADVVLDNYIRACVINRAKPDLARFHQTIVEDTLHGYDVLNSAVHLTASTLALRVPDRPINVTHLWRMPLGGSKRALGTLEFLERKATEATLFSEPEDAPEQVLGKKGHHARPATIPQLDLCVMNPPFTRSVGGNLLFGNLPDKERAKMQTRLKSIVSRKKIPASITAGLGSVFVALGDRFLKEGGRLCLVLPRALVSGIAWGRTRELIAERYDLEYLVVSHEPDHWNFSENTELSEVLVVAHKRGKAVREGARTVCVNLWQQPRTAIESLSLARRLTEGDAPDVETGHGVMELNVGQRKLGEAVSMPWSALRGASWNLPGAFAQTELVRTLLHAARGRIYLPGQGVAGHVSLCPLIALGELGFDRRDMHDGFTLAKGTTHYPAFWCHKAAMVNALRQRPNQWLLARTRPAKGRPARDANHLWQKAGKVLLAERLWLKTVRAVSVHMTEKVLSNVWWSFVFHEQKDAKISDAEKALVLWLNSTLGIMILLGQREETRGAWVDFKKPSLLSMPVLDPWNLPPAGLSKLAAAYDEVADSSLLTLAEIDCDTTRRAIDESLGQVLGLPDLSILRDLLAREPIVRLSLNRLLPHQ